jgi:hypothetical protein
MPACQSFADRAFVLPGGLFGLRRNVRTKRTKRTKSPRHPFFVSGGVFQVVKTAPSRGRTGRTLLRLRFLLSAGAPVGCRNAGGRRDPSLSCHIYCCYTQVIAPTCADAFPVVGGGARVKRSGAGPNRAVVKAALTCGFLLP